MEAGSAGPVCAEMLVQEVLLRYPATLGVFRRHGYPCPACLASVYENVTQIANMLGVDPAVLLADLNAAAATSPAARLPYGHEPSAN